MTPISLSCHFYFVIVSYPLPSAKFLNKFKEKILQGSSNVSREGTSGRFSMEFKGQIF